MAVACDMPPIEEKEKRREDKVNKLYVLTIYPFKQILKVRIKRCLKF